MKNTLLCCLHSLGDRAVSEPELGASRVGSAQAAFSSCSSCYWGRTGGKGRMLWLRGNNNWDCNEHSWQDILQDSERPQASLRIPPLLPNCRTVGSDLLRLSPVTLLVGQHHQLEGTGSPAHSMSLFYSQVVSKKSLLISMKLDTATGEIRT